MTVTPKIDPRKDRAPKRARVSQFAAYTAWAFVALGALGAAGSVFVWRDGKAPVQMAAAPVKQAPQVVINPNSERELSRLNEAVRVLAAERDRLANRLEQLERSVGDITASIPQTKRAPIAQEPPPAPTAPDVQVVNPPNPSPRPQVQGPNQIMPPQPQQQPPQAVTVPPVATAAPQANQQPATAAEQPTRTEFGIDLGGEKSVDGLRARWATLRGNHGTVFDGLRPVIAIKEGQKAGTVELRLVVGPVANAAAAARVCARLQTSGVPCVPTVFDGQRLSLR
jgi:hypothetical protein